MTSPRSLSPVTLASALLFAIGCATGAPVGGDDDEGDDHPDAAPDRCAGASPPSDCGPTICAEDVDCSDDRHCGAAGQCVAECASDDGCVGDETCSARGRCEGDDGCPAVAVTLTPVVPTVVLLIDQSGSMTADFGDTDRWNAVRDALTSADDGVLPRLDQRIVVGATLYTESGGGTCPDLTSVAPALGNAAAITALLDASEPENNTPTAEAVTAVTASFPASDGPRILVLATDGDPDTCADPDSNGDPGPRAGSEAAVQAAYAAGVTTYVLSVGADAEANHLARLARAGQGQDLASGAAAAYLADDPAELLAAFTEIIGGATSCAIDLDGTVEADRADEGTVILDGTALGYATDWRLSDGDTIELMGAACAAYLGAAEVSLTAEFPCGGVVVVE